MVQGVPSKVPLICTDVEGAAPSAQRLQESPTQYRLQSSVTRGTSPCVFSGTNSCAVASPDQPPVIGVVSTPDQPPVIRTRPSRSRVAVCPKRGVSMLAVRENLPVAGS